MMGVTGARRRRRGEIGFSERRQTILGEGFIIFYRALSGQFRCHHSNLGTVKKLSNMLQHNDNMRPICYVMLCYMVVICRTPRIRRPGVATEDNAVDNSSSNSIIGVVVVVQIRWRLGRGAAVVTMRLTSLSS